jgi:hypothetical protein
MLPENKEKPKRKVLQKKKKNDLLSLSWLPIIIKESAQTPKDSCQLSNVTISYPCHSYQSFIIKESAQTPKESCQLS